MRQLTRQTAVVAASAALLLTPTLLLDRAAGAAEHERVTVAEGDVVEREYPPIPGQDPAGEFTGPESCRSTQVTCDVIPITIDAPSVPGAEYFVRISVFWEAEPDPSGFTSFTTNDLDLYFWHDPPRDMTATSTFDDPETEEDESDSENPGASGRLPERINFFSTEAGDFLLVVSNFLGQNQGYTLEVRYFPTGAAPPTAFSQIGAQVQPPAAPAATTPSPPPPPASAPAFTPPPPPELASPVLEPAPLEIDPDFAGFGTIDLGEELAAPPEREAFFRASARPSPPGDPSMLALVIWLALVPVVGLAAGGALLRRRRPAVLRIG